jgi:hypothetical protein
MSPAAAAVARIRMPAARYEDAGMVPLALDARTVPGPEEFTPPA